MQASCAEVIATVPAAGDGHIKRPRSSRLAYRHGDPVAPRNFDQITALAAKEVKIAGLMSVWPTASHTRAPDGTGIIAATAP